MMAATAPVTPQHLLVEALRKALAEVSAQTPAGPWSVERSSEEASQASDQPRLCFGLALSGTLKGSAAIQIRQADALLLAQKLRSEAANPAAELTAEHKQAIQTLLQQVSLSLATALQNQVGAVEVELSAIEVPSWPEEPVVLRASEASGGKVMFELRFDPELTANVTAAVSADTVSQTPTAATAEVAESNLDLLLGVGLSLTLRFGQRVLTLREVLDLSSGSVVELDRQVQEPADLLLGDRLVARGEVVIVDGNYGVRVTEVVDPRQRIDRV